MKIHFIVPKVVESITIVFLEKHFVDEKLNGLESSTATIASFSSLVSVLYSSLKVGFIHL